MTTETVIGRPVGKVAAYAGDPSTAPEWYANIEPVDWKTPPPLLVGSAVIGAGWCPEARQVAFGGGGR